MGDDTIISQSHITSLDKQRNPTFSKDEIDTLIKLVDKYKAIILNKSTVAAVNHAKEVAWIKIAELFNSQGFKYTRPTDCLKIKWENLKRKAKRVSNNLMDPKYDEYCDLTNPVLSMLCEAETSCNGTEVPQEIKEELKQAMNEQKLENLEKLSNTKQESDNSDGENDRKMRSLNFSPHESSILLKCVKEEQKYVFSKENTKTAIQLKRRAWSRITEAFNKKSPQKRSTVTLQNKFCNMKRDVKKRYFKKFLSKKKHEKLIEEDIKIEPDFDKLTSDRENEDNGENSDDIGDDVSPLSVIKSSPVVASVPINNIFDGDNDQSKNGSLQFTPYEVSLLLKCAKEEQKHIFSKGNTPRAVHVRNKAWSRITEAYNEKTRQERSTKVLRTKFTSLRKNMRPGRGNFKRAPKNNQEKLDKESKKIKAEPRFEYKVDSDEDNNNEDDDDDDDSEDEVLRPAPSPEPAPDPLGTVLSSDSGLGSTSFIGAYNFGNDEVKKLKLELLKYQMENAKLERQRIQEAMKADSEARESQAVERSLRLRAARLDAAAAELRLPSTHPALRYTGEEAPAQRHLEAIARVDVGLLE